MILWHTLHLTLAFLPMPCNLKQFLTHSLSLQALQALLPSDSRPSTMLHNHYTQEKFFPLWGRQNPTPILQVYRFLLSDYCLVDYQIPLNFLILYLNFAVDSILGCLGFCLNMKNTNLLPLLFLIFMLVMIVEVCSLYSSNMKVIFLFVVFQFFLLLKKFPLPDNLQNNNAIEVLQKRRLQFVFMAVLRDLIMNVLIFLIFASENKKIDRKLNFYLIFFCNQIKIAEIHDKKNQVKIKN